MSALLFGAILVVVGVLIAIAGQLLPRDWQRRLALLFGALLFLGGLMSGLMEMTTSLLWNTPNLPDDEPAYQPGTLIAGLNEESESTWTVIPSLTVRSQDLLLTETPGSILFPPTSTATDIPLATDTLRAPDTPGPTDTPGPPTPTPTATDTARPIPIDVTPVTAVATEAPEKEPTPEKSANKPTPEPEPRRLSLKKLDTDLRAVAITDPTLDAQIPIFELGGRSRFNPIYSAAWSPDGKRVAISYGWLTSEYDQGIRMQIVNADGSDARDILSLSTAGQYRGLGNALWSPAGDKIIFAFYDGPDNGVWEINPDGTGLRRLGNSEIGEWPRYWSVDGAWIITISGDGSLYALEVAGGRRLPLADLGDMGIYDPRYHPWRARQSARCEQQEDSWWKCK